MMGRLLGPDYMIVFDSRQSLWLVFDKDGKYFTRGPTAEIARINADAKREALNEIRGSIIPHTEPNQTV